VIGFLIGAVARIFISALDTAGMIISFHTGLANAQLFNPAFSTQGSLIGAFLTILGVTLLFTTELYAILIYGLVESYNIFPMGGIPPTDDMALLVSQAVAGSFRVGFQIAVPFMTIALMLFIGMGVLSRLMPQVQVFILSIPVQILLSLITMSLVLSVGMIFWLNHFRESITFFFSS
jgi:flagellar biosynthetic protein FliR